MAAPFPGNAALSRRRDSPAMSRRRFGLASAVLTLAALPLGLGACTSTPPLEPFDLTALPVSVLAPKRRVVIAIDEPNAPALVATNRVVIRRPGGELAYLAGAQWSDQLTQLVQRRLIDSFENAGLFQAVAETGTASDVILSTDIRRFEVDGETGRAVVELAVRLLNARTGRTVKGAVLSGTAPAPDKGAAPIVAALDAAFGEAVSKTLRFATSG